MISADTFSLVLQNYLPEPHASLLRGITYGVSIPDSLNLYNQMKRVGLSHIAVFSGANIAITLSAFSFIRAYIGIKAYSLITILIVFFMIEMVRIKAPIMRASLLSLCTYVGIILGRRTNSMYLLGLSALVLLATKPFWISSVSFHLSYGATFGLLLASRTKMSESASPLLNYFKSELQTSLFVLITTAPVIFYHFRQFSPISPLANLLVSWIIPPIFILGLISGILGNIHPTLGYIPGHMSYPMLSYLIFVSEYLSQFSFASIYFY